MPRVTTLILLSVVKCFYKNPPQSLESEQVSPAPGSLITRLSKPQSQEQRWEVQSDPTAHQFLFSS